MKVWGLRSCLVVYSVRCSYYLSLFMPAVGVMGVVVLVLWVCGALLGVFRWLGGFRSYAVWLEVWFLFVFQWWPDGFIVVS